MDDIDFSYDGNDEEAKRIASEPKKPVKVVPVKKKIELKPIELPEQPLETAVDITTVVVPPDHPPALIHEEHTQTTAQVVVKMPQKSENDSEINTPLLAVAAVAAAASVSLAASALKGKTNLKKNNKTKLNKDNRSEEEKKKEEQKACDSKSDKVQQLIDDVNSVINNNFVEQVSIKKDDKFANRIAALNLEIIALNKRLKKLEDKKKTTYTKRR